MTILTNDFRSERTEKLKKDLEIMAKEREAIAGNFRAQYKDLKAAISETRKAMKRSNEEFNRRVTEFHEANDTMERIMHESITDSISGLKTPTNHKKQKGK